MSFFYFLQKYWYYIAGSIFIILLIILGNRDNRLIGLILKKQAEASKRFDKQSQKIRELKVKEREAKAQSERQYNAELEGHRMGQEARSNEIDRVAVDKALNAPEPNLEDLANKLRDRFGVK